VAVQKDGFDVGKEGVVAVEIGPARLHHADFVAIFRIQEIGNGATEKIGFRKKIGIEDGRQ
jgi:hypothetical protein